MGFYESNTTGNTHKKCVTLQIYRKSHKIWEEIKDFRAIIRITNRAKQNNLKIVQVLYERK